MSGKSKRKFKDIIGLLMIGLFIVSLANSSLVYGDKVDYGDYIKNLKLEFNKKENWLLDYTIDKNILNLYLLGGGNGNLQWIEKNNSMRLKKLNLIIETENIKSAEIVNKNDKHGTNIRLDKTAEELKAGIIFNDLGKVDLETPIEIILKTEDGKKVEYKMFFLEKKPEFELELRVTPQDMYDKTIKAGIDLGNGNFINGGKFKLGDRVNLKASDGSKSVFRNWHSIEHYQNPPEGHNPSESIKLEDFIGDVNSPDLTFTIDEKFKNLKTLSGKPDYLGISVNYNFYNEILLSTSHGDNPKLKAKSSKDKVLENEEFTLEASSEDESMEFERWEIYPIITGVNTENPDADLKNPKLTLKTKNIIIQGNEGEDQYKLEVKAIFKEKEAEKLKYKVSFISNGGSSLEPVEVEEGQKLVRPIDPIRSGYKFIGWYEDETLIKDFDFDVAISKEINLYAKWEKLAEDSLEINSVELIKDGSIITKARIDGNNINLTVPKELTGSIVNGQYYLRVKGTEGSIISQEGGESKPIEEWTNDKITNLIGYDSPTKININKDGKLKDYIIEITKEKVISSKYKVNFISNGGSSIGSIEVEEGSKLKRPTDPIRDGYRFIGWYEDENLTNEFDFENPISKDMNLYAKWEKSEKEKGNYRVSFISNGGSSVGSIEVEEGSKLKRPVDPIKDGYRFIGWYEDQGFSRSFDFERPISKDMTLYARWEKLEGPINKLDAKITSFRLLGVEASIDHLNERIYINLPYRTSLRSLKPEIICSDGASIRESDLGYRDFDHRVTYLVSGPGLNSKLYDVDVSMPREGIYEGIINRPADWYRENPNSKSDSKDWYKISQELKAERLKAEFEKTPNEVKKEALNQVMTISGQSDNSKRNLSFKQFGNYMEVKLNQVEAKDISRNKIIIPSGVLKNLAELKFDYLKYDTGSLKLKVYPIMDGPDGLHLNIKPAPNEKYNNIQAVWSKVKGGGNLFEIESNSTKAGLSLEIKQDKKLPKEKLRLVKYNYMKRQFEDISPDKWSVVDGYIHVDQVSAGIYGVIYK